jgi:hypothetical protein
LAQAVLAALEARDNPSKDFREALQARWEDVLQAAKRLEELGVVPSFKFS